MSGNRMLARDPLGAVGCRVGPLWLWPVMAHPADAQSECDPGILEAGPCFSSHSGAFFAVWLGALSQCVAGGGGVRVKVAST